MSSTGSRKRRDSARKGESVVGDGSKQADEDSKRKKKPALKYQEGKIELLLVLGVCVAFVSPLLHNVLNTFPKLSLQIGFSIAVSVCVGFLGTWRLIPLAGSKILGKLSGVDLGKRGLGFPGDGQPIPESMGLVSGTLCLVCIILTQFFFARGNADLLLDYHAALLAICFAMLLGLADDVMDLKWSQKLVIGAIASIPLCASYDGPTAILIPKQLRFLLVSEQQGQRTIIGDLLEIFHVSVPVEAHGSLVDLGWVYILYMLMLAVFCTNAVNIYAGINGLETGQSLVVGFSIIAMDLMEIAAQADPDSQHVRNHLFSLMIMIPFVCTTFGLMFHNWYPAKAFVGDVYPYYAGMTFAACAILGHYSKSLLLLLIPQVLNFLYSAPQLFHFVPIPRHRLPRVNPSTGNMEPSKVAPDDPRSNMTLICLALDRLGPLHERTLCLVLIGVQMLCSLFGLGLRYLLARLLFGTTS